MKTVCVLDSISRANGGIFEAERQLQRHLAGQCGVDVSVVGLHDKFSELDVPAWHPLIPQTVDVTGPRALGYAADLTDVLRTIDADLGYLAGLWKYPSIAIERWATQMNRPMMIAPHGMLDPWALKNSAGKKRLAGWAFQNRQLREATCLRALCDAEATAIRAYGLRNPICMVPNGVDLPSLAPGILTPHPPMPVGRKTLLYLGRLHPKKGLATLLRAWKLTQPQFPEWQLAIAGWDQDGHEAELKRVATALDMQWSDQAVDKTENRAVRFLGPQFEAAKDASYRACDAFVLPSLSEGLPMALLEAWAYGKPSLMTPACNLPEGIEAGAGILMNPELQSVTVALRKLFTMSDGDRHTMGSQGRSLVQRRFDWRALSKEMASVYEWMLGGGGPPDCVETSKPSPPG